MRIFLILFLLCTPIFAQEVIPDFSENSLPVINEDLRKKETQINELRDWYSNKPPTTLSITGGVITVTQSVHAVDTEIAGSTDDLATINGGPDGAILTLYATSSARTIVFKDGSGNLKLSSDFSADNTEDTIMLIRRGLNWYEMSEQDNGA